MFRVEVPEVEPGVVPPEAEVEVRDELEVHRVDVGEGQDGDVDVDVQGLRPARHLRHDLARVGVGELKVETVVLSGRK